MKKIKRVLMGAMAGSALFLGCTAVNANVTVVIPSIENFCANLSNSTWSGHGVVSGALSCEYAGGGVLSGAEPNYQLALHIEKTKGNFLCPASFDHNLSVTCTNNHLTVYDDYVDLKGQMNGPNQMQASGTVGYHGITANLSLVANRTG